MPKALCTLAFLIVIDTIAASATRHTGDVAYWITVVATAGIAGLIVGMLADKIAQACCPTDVVRHF